MKFNLIVFFLKLTFLCACFYLFFFIVPVFIGLCIFLSWFYCSPWYLLTCNFGAINSFMMWRAGLPMGDKSLAVVHQSKAGERVNLDDKEIRTPGRNVRKEQKEWWTDGHKSELAAHSETQKPAEWRRICTLGDTGWCTERKCQRCVCKRRMRPESTGPAAEWQPRTPTDCKEELCVVTAHTQESSVRAPPTLWATWGLLAMFE